MNSSSKESPVIFAMLIAVRSDMSRRPSIYWSRVDFPTCSFSARSMRLVPVSSSHFCNRGYSICVASLPMWHHPNPFRRRIILRLFCCPQRAVKRLPLHVAYLPFVYAVVDVLHLRALRSFMFSSCCALSCTYRSY